MMAAVPFVLLLLLASTSVGFELPGNSSPSNVPKSCRLPTGKPAFCVTLQRCKELSVTVGNLQKPLPIDVALLIRDSYFCEANDQGQIEVCCPITGIDPPVRGFRPTLSARDSCGLQPGRGPAVCLAYNNCSPFNQLLANVRRPIPPELPALMRAGWMCGLETANGVRVPKVCCPEASVSLPPTTPPPPQTDLERFEAHPNRKLLPDSESCGSQTVMSRIVGGQDADLGQFPWLVNLGFSVGGNSEVSFKCGGALISERFVLTAAHCVTNLPGTFQLVRIRVGEHDLRQDPDCESVGTVAEICHSHQDFNIEKIIPHASYNSPNNFQNDIALVKLDRDVELRDYVIPICLPFSDDRDESYLNAPIDIRTQVAGWGATNERGRDPADVLQFLKVGVSDAAACRETYAARGGVLTPSEQMCAGGEKGKDSCVGDSGSALMRETVSSTLGTQFKIIGVVSFGPRLCGTEGVPGVYTRVRHYLDWILDNLEA